MDDIIGDRYQWINGEKFGTVEIVKDTTDEWINFESGNRIASDLFKKYMSKIDNDNDIISKSPSTENKRDNKKDNKKSKNNTSDNSLMSLFDKMSNLKDDKILIELDINIPDVETYNLLKNSFGEDEINKIFYEFIHKQIKDKKILNDYIDKSIKNLIQLYS